MKSDEREIFNVNADKVTLKGWFQEFLMFHNFAYSFSVQSCWKALVTIYNVFH